MIAGCYSLDLYCDAKATPLCTALRLTEPRQFTAETGGECRRTAREEGWRLDLRNGTAVCPACACFGARPAPGSESSAPGGES